jgi:DNA-binding transcriptional LysR family regulator
MNKFLELNTFVGVVDAGGIAEAARRLGVSKSVVSQRIQSFEKRLNACLLERSHRLRITSAGQQLYDRAVYILAELAHAEEAVQTECSGRLRIAVPTVFGSRYLSPILNLFAKQHPAIHLDVEASDNLVRLRDGNFDVAVRIETPPDSSLIAKAIVENRQVICASPEYLAKRGVPLHPLDLGNHDGLIYAPRESSGHWKLLADGQMQTFPIRRRLRTDSGFQLLDAARQGLGLAILPTFHAADAIVAGDLQVVLEDFTPDGGWISGIYPASRRGSMKIHALIRFIREHLEKPPCWDTAIRGVRDSTNEKGPNGSRSTPSRAQVAQSA